MLILNIWHYVYVYVFIDWMALSYLCWLCVIIMFMSTKWHNDSVDFMALCLFRLYGIVIFMLTEWYHYVYVECMALLCLCWLYGIIIFMSTIWYYVYVDYMVLCFCRLNEIMFMSTNGIIMLMSTKWHNVYVDYMALCLCRLYGNMFMWTIWH